MFSEYKRSVEARYPPICADCAPAVEEEIRRRDTMARTRALGGFLGASNPQRRQIARTQRERDKLTREMFFWKVRGVLWLAYLLCALGHYALGKDADFCCRRPGSLVPFQLRSATPDITYPIASNLAYLYSS